LASDIDLLVELYSAPPEQFVSERTRIVRALRDDGRDDEAGELAGRRKPPLPARLANLLARERSDEVAALIGAAERLSAAHRSGNAENLREAQAALGETLRKLVVAAPAVVGKPVSDSVAKRLSETLRAAAVDPGSAHLLRHSILPDEVQAGGFELLAGLPMSRRASRRRPEARRAPRPKPSDDARLARLRGELDDARRALRSAQAALTSAERDVARRRKRVSELEARIERAK